MLRNLKFQLLITSISAIFLLVLGIWNVTQGQSEAAIVVMVLLCAYLVVVNLWFWHYVTDPIDKLIDYARRIGSGSYGIKVE